MWQPDIHTCRLANRAHIHSYTQPGGCESVLCYRDAHVLHVCVFVVEAYIQVIQLALFRATCTARLCFTMRLPIPLPIQPLVSVLQVGGLRVSIGC